MIWVVWTLAAASPIACLSVFTGEVNPSLESSPEGETWMVTTGPAEPSGPPGASPTTSGGRGKPHEAVVSKSSAMLATLAVGERGQDIAMSASTEISTNVDCFMGSVSCSLGPAALSKGHAATALEPPAAALAVPRCGAWWPFRNQAAADGTRHRACLPRLRCAAPSPPCAHHLGSLGPCQVSGLRGSEPQFARQIDRGPGPTCRRGDVPSGAPPRRGVCSPRLP